MPGTAGPALPVKLGASPSSALAVDGGAYVAKEVNRTSNLGSARAAALGVVRTPLLAAAGRFGRARPSVAAWAGRRNSAVS